MRPSSKGFSTTARAKETLFPKKFIAIAACLIFIFTLTGYYYAVESGFNPNPQQSALTGANICFPDKQVCQGFVLGNVTLREFNRTDISTQQVLFTVTPEEQAPMARIYVYVDNVSMGTVEGPFASGVPRSVALGVPTTIDVTPGVSYSVVVEGVFGGSSGTSSADYWQSVSVVAVAG